MKKIYLLALGLVALPVLADNFKGFYAGAGVSNIQDYQDGIENLSRIKAFELSGGYKYNDALDVELRLGKGLETGHSRYYFDSTGTLNTGTLTREIGPYQTIYYRPELVNDEAKLYALLGYTHVSSSVTIKDVNGVEVSRNSNSASGASYGIGISFVVDDHFNVNFEYKNICDGISGKPNFATIAMDYRF